MQHSSTKGGGCGHTRKEVLSEENRPKEVHLHDHSTNLFFYIFKIAHHNETYVGALIKNSN